MAAVESPLRAAIKRNLLEPQDLKEIVSATHMTGEEILKAYKHFAEDSPEGKINKIQFQNIYETIFPHGNTELFAENVFRCFDVNQDGVIEFREFLVALSVLGRGSEEEKIDWMFKLYDLNDNGHIDLKEMEQVINTLQKMYGLDVKLNTLPKSAGLAETVLEQMDADHDGKVTLEEFREAFLNNCNIRDILDLDPHFN